MGIGSVGREGVIEVFLGLWGGGGGGWIGWLYVMRVRGGGRGDGSIYK